MPIDHVLKLYSETIQSPYLHYGFWDHPQSVDLDKVTDMAIFAKALGNGYPISAVIGKRSIMNFAQSTFISSTMWTERLGFIAGMTSLKKMKKL